MVSATQFTAMKIPLWTMLLCSIASVIFFVPSLGDAAIFDRDSIVSGEWWRLITGNLVHLSAMHFISDVLALFVVGTIIELRGDRFLALVYCTAGMVIGLVVFMTSPELRYFGGLSGIVTAAAVYLCLEGLRDTGAWRWLCLFGLVLVAIKIGLEFMFGQSLLSVTEPHLFVPVPASHLAGACTALFVFILTRYKHGIQSLCERGALAKTSLELPSYKCKGTSRY